MFNGCGQAAEQIVSNKIYTINTPVPERQGRTVSCKDRGRRMNLPRILTKINRLTHGSAAEGALTGKRMEKKV